MLEILTNEFDAELDCLVLSLMKKYNVHSVGYALIDDYAIRKVNTINEALSFNLFSLFQSCSFSKSITAYAVLDLIAKQKIKLDSPINFYLDSWKIRNSAYNEVVTVRHCLNMTSGLCFGDVGTTFSGYSQDDKIPSLSEILCGLDPAKNSAVKVVFEPGSQYHYSGAGYMVLQQLIEDIVKQPFIPYMNNVILPKLGMKNSTFECPLSEERRHQAIPGYGNDGIQVEGGWDHIVGAASGGLWSCPEDVANFLLQITEIHMERSWHELGKEINEMLSRQKNTDFGLGVDVNGNGESLCFRKNGYNSGYYNEFIMLPNCGKGIVVMTNSAVGEDLINDLVRFVSDKINWPDCKLNYHYNV